MKILILAGSPRKCGNTDLLVESFVKGASQKHHVEVVSVHNYEVSPCMGYGLCEIDLLQHAQGWLRPEGYFIRRNAPRKTGRWHKLKIIPDFFA